MDFAVPADHRVKLKEIEKYKYLDLARELKKTLKHESDGDAYCNWCTWQSPKDMEIRGRVETIRTTTLLRSARILRTVLETWGDLLSHEETWGELLEHEGDGDTNCY